MQHRLDRRMNPVRTFIKLLLLLLLPLPLLVLLVLLCAAPVADEAGAAAGEP